MRDVLRTDELVVFYNIFTFTLGYIRLGNIEVVY